MKVIGESDAAPQEGIDAANANEESQVQGSGEGLQGSNMLSSMDGITDSVLEEIISHGLVDQVLFPYQTPQQSELQYEPQTEQPQYLEIIEPIVQQISEPEPEPQPEPQPEPGSLLNYISPSLLAGAELVETSPTVTEQKVERIESEGEDGKDGKDEGESKDEGEGKEEEEEEEEEEKKSNGPPISPLSELQTLLFSRFISQETYEQRCKELLVQNISLGVKYYLEGKTINDGDNNDTAMRGTITFTSNDKAEYQLKSEMWYGAGTNYNTPTQGQWVGTLQYDNDINFVETLNTHRGAFVYTGRLNGGKMDGRYYWDIRPGATGTCHFSLYKM